MELQTQCFSFTNFPIFNKNLLFRIRLVAGSFLLKLKTMSMCLELKTFIKGLNSNVYGQRQIDSQKYCRLQPEQTLLQRQPQLQKFKETVTGGVTIQLKYWTIVYTDYIVRSLHYSSQKSATHHNRGFCKGIFKLLCRKLLTYPEKSIYQFLFHKIAPLVHSLILH